MKLIRDDLGFLDISPIINPANYGKRHFTFTYKDKTYYYKRNKDIKRIYNELIAEEIAKDINLPHAHYDIVSFDEEIGVISESFLKPGDKLILMEDFLTIIRDYSSLIDEKNNLDDIWLAIELKYRDEIVTYELMNQVIKIFLFDSLIANSDRHCCNIGVIEGKDGVRITPAYDNEEMLYSSSIVLGSSSLGVRREDYKKYDKNMLEVMLNMGSEIYLEQLEGLMWVIDDENILKILERVSKRIEAPLYESITKKIIDDFKLNRKNIEEIINKVKDNKSKEKIKKW